MDANRSIIRADCATCPASHIPILAERAMSRREMCLAYFRLVTFDAKRPIYDRGERGAVLFILRRGLVKLVRRVPDGGERIVRLKRPGDSFGLEALLGREYQHRAVSATACEVCRLPAETILGFGRDNPLVRESVVAQHQKSVDAADMFLSELATGHADVRVARLLLYLAGGEAADHPLLTREDIGAVIGITTETASRTIADFRRRGLIELLDEHRFRCNPDALVAIATR